MLLSQHPEPTQRPTGSATLVGAGPGALDLLTLRAVRAIERADAVLYDALVDPAVLDFAPAHARRIDVGKRCGRHAMKQAAISRLIVTLAQEGAHVVRLKGGDPLLFGRGGEELDELRAANIPVEVVPGVTAACAAAASLQVPLTHRGLSRSVHMLTGHGADGDVPAHDWAALSREWRHDRGLHGEPHPGRSGRETDSRGSRCRNPGGGGGERVPPGRASAVWQPRQSSRPTGRGRVHRPNTGADRGCGRSCGGTGAASGGTPRRLNAGCPVPPEHALCVA